LLKLKQKYEGWAAMTKYKKHCLCTRPPFCHFFSPFFLDSKTSYLSHRDSIFKMKVSKGLLKPWQKFKNQVAMAK